MPLVLVGTDYREVGLEDLDLLNQAKTQIEQSLVGQKSTISGAAVISTCNRFEIYLDCEDAAAASKFALRKLLESNATGELSSQNFRLLTESAAVQHLFAVSAGLESMVVGEEEIAGQVKRAFSDSQANGHATTALVQVFQKAAEVAKRVTSQTGLGSAGRSTITVALDYLESRNGSHAGKRALLIGTGAHARVVVAALKRSGYQHIQVFSPSGRAQDFALSRGLTSLTSSELPAAIESSDLLVSCSGNAGAHLTFEAISQAVQNRALLDLNGKPLMVIDVSLSRDVSPRVAELTGVDFVNLEVIRQHAPAEHGEAILEAQNLVNEGVAAFEREKLERNLGPFVAAIKKKIELWIDEEVDRVRKRDGEQAAVEAKAGLIAATNQMLHEPITKAKSLVAGGTDEDYRKAVLTLFGDYSV